MRWRLTFLAAVAIVAVAGVAVAANGGSSGKVTLCPARATAPSASLARASAAGEKKLTISKQGPPGLAGAPGPAGATGPAGVPGTTAPIQPEARCSW